MKRLMMALLATMLVAATMPGVAAAKGGMTIQAKGHLPAGSGVGGPVTFKVSAKSGPGGEDATGKVRLSDLEPGGVEAEGRVVRLCGWDMLYDEPDLSLPIMGVVAEWSTGAPYSGTFIMAFGDGDPGFFGQHRLLFLPEADGFTCEQLLKILVFVDAVWGRIDGKVKIKGVTGPQPA